MDRLLLRKKVFVGRFVDFSCDFAFDTERKAASVILCVNHIVKSVLCSFVCSRGLLRARFGIQVVNF